MREETTGRNGPIASPNEVAAAGPGDGEPLVAELCYDFSDERWRQLQAGSRIEVVYMPDSVMRVGDALVAAEIRPLSDIQ